jgi:GMP synthase (glutamine-hydrolysing)
VKPVLVIKTGSTVPNVRERRGDFEDWIELGLAMSSTPVETASIFEGDALPEPSTLAGIVITGSSAMVSEREAWSERCASWLPGAIEAGIPTLGICYGHQLLAHALGGEVGRNPNGREIGTIEVDLRAAEGDALLGAFAPGADFHASHVESVLALPPGATRLGSNAIDPNHAYRVEAPGVRAWGVQFHPEFDADVMRGYLEARRELLEAEALDVGSLMARTRETPAGWALLARFGTLVEASWVQDQAK